MKINCGSNGYIGKLNEFGFAYKEDKEYGGFTDGTALCNHIKSPLDKYKKPMEKPCAETNTTCIKQRKKIKLDLLKK